MHSRRAAKSWKLLAYVLERNLDALRAARITPRQFLVFLRRQVAFASLFKSSKACRVGERVFMDPFAPYFPSAYFDRLLVNNCAEEFPLKPNYAQISITNRCPCDCIHCHAKDTTDGEVPAEKILDVIDDLVALDFPTIFFVGGEPLSRFDDLVRFVEAARGRMDARIFTSGVGGTRERFARLRDAGLSGACVSVDHWREQDHDAKRAHVGAYQAALAAIGHCRDLGLYVSVVCCTTHAMVERGDVFRVVDLVESLGANSVQINEIRPAGKAARRGDPDLFLTEDDERILVDYYERQNAGPRPIAIVLPWHHEAPTRFGCMATAAQKVYVDGKGEVQPCELLRVSFGNVKERRFSEIWQELRARCGHPVRECILHPLVEQLRAAPALPLPPSRTRELWPALCALEAPDIYKKLRLRNERFSAFYDLGLKEAEDFRVLRNHWLPRALGLEYLALGTRLFARGDPPELPRHEFLHLAQFRRFGAGYVLRHYLYHLARNLLRTRSLGRAFREVPFEVEARAFAAGQLSSGGAERGA